MAEYSQWWEAFAGGEFEDWEGGELAPGEDYLGRTQAFYSQVVGPSFGYTGEDPFGDIFNEYVASFDVEAMEQAEEAFRMSIGDPYGGFAADPYRWESVSRMTPEQAQAQLEGTLYGAGEFIGGTTGAEYGTSTAVGQEAYTSGLSAQREALTYGGLTGSQSLLSGTSGSVLRSGAGITQAEDVLSEAYKKSKTLGAEFMETGETTQMSLEENLNTALTAYLDILDAEKSTWFNNIMSQVTTASSTWGAEFGGEAEEFEDWQSQWEEGIVYGDWTPEMESIMEWQEEAWESGGGWGAGGQGGCGIGELWIDGECQPYEGLDIEYDSFGEPCVQGVDECGVCGGDGSSCAPGTGDDEIGDEEEMETETDCPEGQVWHWSGQGVGYCVDEDECVCPPGIPGWMCEEICPENGEQPDTGGGGDEGGDEGGDACGGCPPGEVCNSWSGNCYDPTPGQPEGSEDILGTPGKFPGATPTGGY